VVKSPERKRLPAAFWRSATGSEPVREWLRQLAKDDKYEIGTAIKTVEYGWPIGMPVCRPLGAGLWEVRIDLAQGRTARVLFSVHGRLMVLLHAFVKKTQKTAILVTHDQDEAFQVADRVGVLNQGRLEQVGTPEEIYQAPTSRFVADFVGAADFIPGTVLREGIRTELGLFANPKGLPIGRRVDVMIRPDEVTIVADPDGPAVVTERLYLGADKVYTLRLPSEAQIRSNQHSTPNLPIGARVAVKISPSHVVTFASE